MASFALPLQFAAVLALAPANAATPGTSGPTALCETSVRAIDAAAARTMKQGSPGMILEVARGGESLFGGTYGHADLEQGAAVRRETVFKYASITKMFTAAAALTLVEQGKLSLHDRLGQHVPEFEAAAQVSIYDLLIQTSGIPDYAGDPSGETVKSVARSSEEMLAWIEKLTRRLDFEPGSKWAYSNSNYVLLGIVIERVAGQSLDTLFEERLFRPAGLTSTAFDAPADVVLHRAEGYRRAKDVDVGFRNAAWISPTIPGAAGGLRGTAQDLTLWAHSLFGGRVLAPESVRAMASAGVMRDGRTTKFGMPEAWQKGLNSDYGMGLFIRPTRAGTRIGHSGDIDGFSTWLAYYPNSGVTIVQMINSQSADLPVDEVEAAVFSEADGPCLR